MEPLCLVLTSYMSPQRVCRWQTAIVDSYLGKVEVLAEYDATVSSPSVTLKIPAVVRIKKSVPRVKRNTKFSRGNIYSRDRNTCQYCGNKFKTKDLEKEHVLPRVKGGKTVWENIVAACSKCNKKKGGRTPEEAGMKLLNHPVRPASLPLVAMFALPTNIPEQWLPYLEGHAVFQQMKETA
jgi:5-methylcytosine-specific restriction endonuclease McrA